MSRIYVGNLPRDVTVSEVDNLFNSLGRITKLDLKTRPNEPSFSFIEFENPRDAEKAVEARHEMEFGGKYIRRVGC